MSAVSAATVLAGASLAATAGGTILSAAGQSQQAAQQAAAANYQAQIARMNQQAAERNAQLALQQGEAQEDRQRLKTAQLMGSQRAAFAAQGGDVNARSLSAWKFTTARRCVASPATSTSRARRGRAPSPTII